MNAHLQLELSRRKMLPAVGPTKILLVQPPFVSHTAADDEPWCTPYHGLTDNAGWEMRAPDRYIVYV